MTTLQTLFPFHVLVDEYFIIRQVGQKLRPLLQSVQQRNVSDHVNTLLSSQHRNDLTCQNNTLIGCHIATWFDFTRPTGGTDWTWTTLQKLADQNFNLVPKMMTMMVSSKAIEHRSVSFDKSASLQFRASMINIDSPGMVLFHLLPDVKNISELQALGLTLTDLPLYSCQRDAILLGEYMVHEVNNAHKLDQLSKVLEHEKKLSNTLLYNLLPRNIADDLRCGKTVEPKQYDNVTLFFSGMFTNMIFNS
jgi:Heme NO binding associated